VILLFGKEAVQRMATHVTNLAFRDS